MPLRSSVAICDCCQKQDSRCKTLDTGAKFCWNSKAEDVVQGFRFVKELDMGMGTMWVPENQAYDYNPFTRQLPTLIEDEAGIIDDDTLHQQYSKLIDQLDLSFYHKNLLTKRGVDPVFMQSVGFRTFTPKKRVKGIANIPGVKDGALTGNKGFLIPMKTPWGQITAFQVATKIQGKKYVFLQGSTKVRKAQGFPIAFAYGFPSFPKPSIDHGVLKLWSEKTTVFAQLEVEGQTFDAAKQVRSDVNHNALLMGLQLALSHGVKSITIQGFNGKLRNQPRDIEVLARLNRELLGKLDYKFDKAVTVDPVQVSTQAYRIAEAFLDTKDVWFVDGTAKAWYTAAKHTKIVLGCPMANHASSDDLIPYLAAIKPERCIHAPDAGDVVNTSNVPRVSRALHKELLRLEYHTVVAWWNQVDKVSGNDIDDRDNLQGIQYITPDEYLALHSADIQSVMEKSVFGSTGIKQVANPAEPPHPIEQREISYFLEGYRKDAVKVAMQVSKVIHDKSFAGAGKSHDFESWTAEDFGVKQLIHVTTEVNKLKLNPNQTPYRGKNQGLIQRESDGRIVNATDADLPKWMDDESDQLLTQANCLNMERIQELQQHGITPEAKKVCNSCPFQEQCKTTKGMYQYDRAQTMKAPQVRMHPSALDRNWIKAANGEPFHKSECNEPGSAIILDDITSAWTTSTVISRKAIRTLIKILEPALVAKPGIRKVLNQVRKIVAKKDKNNRPLNLNDKEFRSQITAKSEVNPEFIDILEQNESEVVHGKLREPDGEYKDLDTVWATKFLRALMLPSEDAQVYTYNNHLVIIQRNERFLEALGSAGVKLILIADATGHTPYLEKWLKLKTEIPVISQQAPENTANLRLVQIVDCGDLGYTRSDSQKEKVKALKEWHRTNRPDYAMIDIKAESRKAQIDELCLTWRSSSRGSNAAEKHGGLVMYGTPRSNLSALRAQYALMMGKAPREGDTLTPYPLNVTNYGGHWVRVLKESADTGFATYCHLDVLAEIEQGLNRLRHARRAGETLEVVFVTQYPLTSEIEALSSADYMSGTVSNKLRTKARDAACSEDALIEAAYQLKESGYRMTYSALASIMGISVESVRWFFKQPGRDWKSFKTAETLTGWTFQVFGVEVLQNSPTYAKNNIDTISNSEPQKREKSTQQGFQPTVNPAENELIAVAVESVPEIETKPVLTPADLPYAVGDHVRWAYPDGKDPFNVEILEILGDGYTVELLELPVEHVAKVEHIIGYVE